METTTANQCSTQHSDHLGHPVVSELRVPAPLEARAPKPYTADNTQIWAWGIGAIASHALIQTYGQANTIFTVGFGLSPAIIAWCMMLPRVVDGVLDRIIGHLSDNTHTRWGRRKPYLIGGAVIGSLFLHAVWWANSHWSSTAQFFYLLTFGTLFYVCYGVYTMAWMAIGYELTDDYHERSKVSAVGGLFLSIVVLGTGWMYWLALRPIFGSVQADGTIKPDEIVGMRWISAGVGVIIIASALIAAWFCKERYANVNRSHVALLPAVKATMRNRPFVILLMIKIFQILGERAAGGILPFLSIYFVCRGNKDLSTSIAGWGATIGIVWGFAVLPAIKPVSRLVGKRGAQICGAGLSLMFALAQPFIYTPEHPYLLLLPSLILTPLVCISNTITTAILPDICDLDELQTGQRREGLFTAVMGFIGKLEISLCFLLVGYLVTWSGLDTKLPTQSDEVLNRLFWLAILPNIFFSACVFVLTLKFPLTERDMGEVRRQLDERHAARASQETPAA